MKKENITEEQRKILIHTLTGSYGKRVTRNWYATNTDNADLIELCELGFMRRSDHSPWDLYGVKACYFHVTSKGADAVGLKIPNTLEGGRK
ncbi:hypothetical protein [Acetobacter persici]|uniref:Uncharacterized protein n=1 Tax=Acetobacter persici TaxID=1076596 RepID=A0A6V8IBA8_9PROT|nr:hypothetical protein [Acetobacter persici]GFE94891.1 hypothetical protein DmAi_29500 [Acetobacter persici]